MKKDNDKRLIIPKDSFEEEASEGLGRLNKDEAAEDIRDLESRMADRMHDHDIKTAKRLRRPIRIWIPAAAAVIIILLASTIYIALFRDNRPVVGETAMAEKSQKDTVLIAMAEPVKKAEADADAKDEIEAEAKDKQEKYTAPVISREIAAADKAEEISVLMVAEEELQDEYIIEVMEENMLSEEAVPAEVIVHAIPDRAMAAQAAASGKNVTKKRATGVAERTEALPKNISPDHSPRPAGGIDELNSWLRSNIRYPSDVSPRTSQQVIVTFRVSPDSTINDLKAERSPGVSFTAEAFRLLREGPRWVPAIRNGNPVEEQMRVRVVFK